MYSKKYKEKVQFPFFGLALDSWPIHTHAKIYYTQREKAHQMKFGGNQA